MLKVNNYMVPLFISDFSPASKWNCGYPLRNNNTLSTPFTQINFSSKSCITSSTRMWNDLDENIYIYNNL